MTVKELLKHAEKFEVDTYRLSRNFRENHIGLRRPGMDCRHVFPCPKQGRANGEVLRLL